MPTRLSAELGAADPVALAHQLLGGAELLGAGYWRGAELVLHRFDPGRRYLTHLDRATGRPIRCYERDRPGELVHVDIKKLANILDGGGHKVLGRPAGKKNSSRTGYSYLTRPSTTTSPRPTARSSPTSARDRHRLLEPGPGMLRPDRDHRRGVMTDNGSCHRTRLWRQSLATAGITYKRTRPYRPRTERDDTFYSHHRGHATLKGQPLAGGVPNLTRQYGPHAKARCERCSGCSRVTRTSPSPHRFIESVSTASAILRGYSTSRLASGGACKLVRHTVKGSRDTRNRAALDTTRQFSLHSNIACRRSGEARVLVRRSNARKGRAVTSDSEVGVARVVVGALKKAAAHGEWGSFASYLAVVPPCYAPWNRVHRRAGYFQNEVLPKVPHNLDFGRIVVAPIEVGVARMLQPASGPFNLTANT